MYECVSSNAAITRATNKYVNNFIVTSFTCEFTMIAQLSLSLQNIVIYLRTHKFKFKYKMGHSTQIIEAETN
jgi:hypothetical protein